MEQSKSIEGPLCDGRGAVEILLQIAKDLEDTHDTLYENRDNEYVRAFIATAKEIKITAMEIRAVAAHVKRNETP